MIGAMARHRVQVLRAGGKTLRRIAAETGIPLRSVKRIVHESPIEQPGDVASALERGVGRPSLVAAYRERIIGVLAAEPKLPTIEILHRLRGLGYRGAKTPLYEAVRGLRPRPVSPLVRFEGLPGEFSQHDFGQVEVRYLDGSEERIHFFASRLKYSRWVDVQLVEDERIEALVRSLLAGFASFAGIPLVAVFDNPRTVTRGREVGVSCGTRPWQVALDYGFGVECTPGRGQEKARSRTCGASPRSFFKVRRFHDHPIWWSAQRLAPRGERVRPCRATGYRRRRASRPSARGCGLRSHHRTTRCAPGDGGARPAW
jgi:transposase